MVQPPEETIPLRPHIEANIPSYYTYNEGQRGQLDTVLKRNDHNGNETSEEVEISSKKDKENGSGIFGACFNITSVTIGSGIIATPYALQQSGVILGTISLLVISVLADSSLIYLVRAGGYSNQRTYQNVMKAAFGRLGFIYITLTQFMFPFLDIVTFLIIIGDALSRVIEFTYQVQGLPTHPVVGDRKLIVAMVTLFLIFPLSLIRNIARYSKVSICTVITIFCMTGFIIYKMVFNLEHNTMKHVEPEGNLEMALPSFNTGIMVLATMFNCHHLTFIVYHSLKEQTESQWKRISHVSMAFICIITLVFSVSGYTAYHKFTQADISDNFCHDDKLAVAFRIAMSVVFILIAPLECRVVKEVIEICVFQTKHPIPHWQNILVTFLILATTYGLSLVTECVSIVIEANGVMFAIPMVFILPPLCAMKLRPEPILSKHNIIPMITSCIGICFFLSGMNRLVGNFIHEGLSCIDPNNLPYCYLSINNGTSDLANHTNAFSTTEMNSSSIYTSAPFP